MRHLVLALALICGAVTGHAFEIEGRSRFGPESDDRVLRIISTADIGFFEPMITSFRTARPDVAIDYVVASSAELMRAILDEGHAFDVAISSAMDLQTKLANDGMATRHVSDTTQSLPDWAAWNDMLFAFTQEPAAIVVSRTGFSDLPVPQDRHELIDLLREHPDRFRGRVGTYDIRVSGLGYLFATQDTRASETYWRLTEVMGGLEPRLYCCSSDMIEAVISGELLIAYNVLGSYVASREDRSDFVTILPSDFTTVMLRTALIPHNAPSPGLARSFVDHLLQRTHGSDAHLLTDPDVGLNGTEQALNRIRIGPGLLVYLDQMKRRAFLSEWESAIVQKRNGGLH